MVHNTKVFVTETNLPFALRSRDHFFKGQNGRKSATSYISNIYQKILFPLPPNLIRFMNKNVVPMTSWSRD